MRDTARSACESRSSLQIRLAGCWHGYDHGEWHAPATVERYLADPVHRPRKRRQAEQDHLADLFRVYPAQPAAICAGRPGPEFAGRYSALLAGRGLVCTDRILQQQPQQPVFPVFLLCHPDLVVPARLRGRRAHHPRFGRPVRRHRPVRRNGCGTVAPAAARHLPAGARLHDRLLGRLGHHAAQPPGAAARCQPAVQSALRRRPDHWLGAGKNPQLF